MIASTRREAWDWACREERSRKGADEGNRNYTDVLIRSDIRRDGVRRVLGLFAVADVYASPCKKGAYAPFSAQRMS